MLLALDWPPAIGFVGAGGFILPEAEDGCHDGGIPGMRQSLVEVPLGYVFSIGFVEAGGLRILSRRMMRADA